MSSIYNKSSLVLIPSGTKTSKVYSQKPTNGDGDFTFTRASAATRVNASGNIEKETGNLMPYSNNFSQWSPKAGVFTQGVADPNGGSTAWSWTAQNTDPYLYLNPSVTGVVTLSIWAKGVGSSIGKNFVLVSSGSSPTAYSHTLTSEWVRYESYFNCTSPVQFGFEIPNPAVAGDVVHIYGAQLNYGTIATDYIETTTAAVYGGITDNTPRLDYTDSSCPALLLEPQRTNLILHSEYFGGWGQINTINTANALISPEGVQNANKLIAASGVNNNVINQQISAGTYTASVFAKKGEFEGLFIGSGPTGAFFNLNTYAYRTHYQSAPTSYKIEDYGNGWHRYSITFTISGNDSLYIGPNDNVSNTLGVTGNNSNGIYIYGATLEVATYPTSYIPTYGSSVSRVVDACSKTGVSSLIGQTEGTMFMDADFKNNAGDQTILISSSGFNDYVFIQMNSSNVLEAGIVVNTVEVARIGVGKTSGIYKCAFSYANNDFVFYVNGVKVGTDSSGSMSGFTADFINLNHNNKGYSLNNYSLFKTRLSNEELAALTTI